MIMNSKGISIIVPQRSGKMRRYLPALLLRTSVLPVCMLLIALRSAAAIDASADNSSTPPSSSAVYSLDFFCLKQNHSIGASQLLLSDNGSMRLRIQQETITCTSGSYSINGLSLSGTVSFVLPQKTHVRYTLKLRGLIIPGSFMAGLATLSEYSTNERHIQDIPFVFIASQKNGTDTRRPGVLPF